MIIAYIEEDVESIQNRISDLLNSIINTSIIDQKSFRYIKLTTGISFIFVTKDELNRLRGLHLAAVFVNCSIEPYDRAGITSQVRPM